MIKKRFLSPFERITSERTSYLLPELIEMQRDSFSSLLENGILEEFSKINPVRSPTGDMSLIFYPKEYKLTPPSFNIREAILQGKTYSSKLYIPTRISFSGDFTRFQDEISLNRFVKEGKAGSKNSLNKKRSFPSSKTSKVSQTPEKDSSIMFQKEEKNRESFLKSSHLSFFRKKTLGDFIQDKNLSGKIENQSNLYKNLKNWTLKCWILVGNLPLMTKRGHFIINGSPRVLVSQMTRCPGVYFHEKWRGLGSQKKRICYADFISRRGAWLRIQVDKNKELSVRLKRTPKIPLDIFQEGFKCFERGKGSLTKGSLSSLENLKLQKNFTLKSSWKGNDLDLSFQERPQKRSEIRKAPSNIQRISLFLGKKAVLTLYYSYPVLTANECDLNSPELLLALQQNPWTWGLKNCKRILKFAFDGGERFSSAIFSRRSGKSKRLQEFLNRFSILRDFGPKYPEIQVPKSFIIPKNLSSEIFNGKALFSENGQISKLGAFQLSENLIQIKKNLTWKVIGNEKKSSKKSKKYEKDFKIIHFLDRNEAVFGEVEKERNKKPQKDSKVSVLVNPLTRSQKKRRGGSQSSTKGVTTCLEKGQRGSTGQKKVLSKRDIKSFPSSRVQNILKKRLIETFFDTHVLMDLFEEIQDSVGRSDFFPLFSHENMKNQHFAATGGLQFIYQKFKNPRSYDLGKVGRKRINEKLQISTSSYQLDSKDIEFASLYLHSLEKNEILPDDIDNLKNRRIRSAGELLQNQLETGIYRLERFVLNRFEVPLVVNPFSSSLSLPLFGPRLSAPLASLRSLVTTKPLNGALREFFGSNPLSQYMDQTNPLAEVTHKRRVSSLGLGGISRDTAGMSIRGIHSSHYGRICPIETPEGKNAGLVNSLTLFGRGARSGFLETPYYRVYKGQVQKTFLQENLFARKKSLLAVSTFMHQNKFWSSDLFVKRFDVIHGSMSPSSSVSKMHDLIKKVPNSHTKGVTASLEKGFADLVQGSWNRGSQATPSTKVEGLPLCVTQSGRGGKQEFQQTNTKRYNSFDRKLSKAFQAKLEGKERERNENKKDSAPLFFSADFEQKMKLVLAPGDLNLSSSDFLPSVPLPVRLAAAVNDPFQKLTRDAIQFIALSPLQMISLATSLIPFLEHDDANRALMGSNMQRQAVPIVRPERAIVGTGLESLVVAESGQALESKRSGLVIYSSSEKIVLHRLKSFLSLKSFDVVPWKTRFNSFENLMFSHKKRLAKIQNKNSQGKNQADLYKLDLYERSNQETCLSHRPAVREGDWVQKGDLLADCSASLGGELALGKNLMIAYIPWEGYNFEDAIVASQKLVSEDLFTSIHIEKHDIEISESKRGLDVITQDIPYITHREKEKLDTFGLIKVGQWVDEGDILVGKVASIKPKPLSPHQKLAFDLARLKPSRTKDTSLRVPKGVHGRIIRVEVLETSFLPDSSEVFSSLDEKILLRKIFKLKEKNYKKQFQALFSLRSFKKKYNLPLSTIFQPGYEFKKNKKLEDLNEIQNGIRRPSTKVYTLTPKWNNLESLPDLLARPVNHSLTRQNQENQVGMSEQGGVQTSRQKIKHFGYASSKSLQNSFLFENWYSLWFSKRKRPRFFRNVRCFFSTLKFPKKTGFSLEIYLPFPKMKRERSLDKSGKASRNFSWNQERKKLEKSSLQKIEDNKKEIEEGKVPTKVRIYLAERRKIQVGDKVAGRHGNKGILSVLLGECDMPYLPDGRPLDMILNPLGVPSRMNVGQVFECLLGLAGEFSNQQYKIPPFDEMYGAETSRSLVYLKLYQARLKTGQHWLFYPTKPGKTRITDGRSGEPFHQFVTVGSAYIIKLVHLVDEKIHARSTGPYSLVTKQPLGGRSKHGGQRLGEMEVWALEGFGAAYTLQEMLTSKSDDVLGRQEVLKAILSKKGSPLGNPEAFKVLVRELQSLCLDIRVSVLTGSPMRRKRVDISQVP
jgi:DNA-directed RNA polymerase beta subunit